MRKTIAACLLMLLALAVGGPPAGADGAAQSKEAVTASVAERYAWIWSGKDAGATQRRIVPVAACTMDCCCEFFEGDAKKTQCKTREQCLTAGGICHKNNDAKCN